MGQYSYIHSLSGDSTKVFRKTLSLLKGSFRQEVFVGEEEIVKAALGTFTNYS